MFLPSQQLGKSRMRSRLLPPGQIGYFVVSRFSKPGQVPLGLAFFGPFPAGLASPVVVFRVVGIGAALGAGLARNLVCGGFGPRVFPKFWSGAPPFFLPSLPFLVMSRSTGQKYA